MAIFPALLNNVAPWLLDRGMKILILIAVAVFARWLGGLFIDKFVRKVVPPDRFAGREAERKREETVVRILDTTLSIVIWVVGGLMVLEEIGIAIEPLLAAAGIAGLAFGFGGQYVIRDLITGLFIIMENQYRIGDVVCLGDTCGLVEDISLRMTSLRDRDGVVHHVPHGSVQTVSNMSKHFSRVNLNIGISYGADLEHVIETVNRVGRELAEDPAWRDRVRSAPQFVRIKDFGDSSVIVKIMGDTAPLAQWDVAGEFRKRLKIAFDKEGIEIPFPQRTVHVKNEPGGEALSSAGKGRRAKIPQI